MAKLVTDRETATNFVASAAETHADLATEAFTKEFGHYLTKKEKDDVRTFGTVLTVIARRMREATWNLVDKSDAHDKELSDDAAPREARDNSAAELTAAVVGIRGTVDSVYGAAGLKVLGLEGETPAEPRAILAASRKLLGRLEEPKLTLPKPVRPGVTIDKAAWIAELKGPIAVLDQALRDVARETREAQATGDAKGKAMDENDDIFTRGARFISAALALVGEAELAAKTRPSTRRPGTTIPGSGDEPAGADPSAAKAPGGQTPA